MHKLRVIAVGVALGAMAFPALAQETTVIGHGSGKPSVTVDLSVLDALGPAPTVPQALRQRPPAPGATQPATHAPSKLKSPGGNGKSKSKATAAKSGKKPQTRTAGSGNGPLQPQMASSPPALPPAMAAAPSSPPPTVTEAQPAAPPPLASLAPSAAPPPAAPALPPAPMTSAAPQAAPAPPPAAPPPQIAALPPTAASLGPGRTMQLAFGESASQLDDNAKRDLDVLVRTIGSDDETRLQLTAYASAPGADNASQARRLSLSRALAVRTYLIEKGVKSTRIDVRALGNKNEGGPADRVDVLVARR
jgi:outer membrane protein OmpA-like peptidoglycan-associated protein